MKEQTGVRVTREVKIISPKGLYTKTPYHYAIPISATSRLPVTGQEHIIMTPDKWSGKEKLSASEKAKLQMGDHPYVINPEDHIIIVHGYKYNNSYDSIIERKGTEDVEVDREYINPKDHAELTAIMAGSETPIAKSKAEYNKTKHHFYIDDKELESQTELDKMNLEYEAEQFVRNDIGSGRYPEMIMFLGYALPEYKRVPKELSMTRMESLVLKACREHPDVVLKYKGPNATRIVFVLKLIQYGIITQDRNLNFNYGDIHLGVNLDSVVGWMENMKDHGNVVTKWQRLLDLQEGKSAEAKLPE